MGMGRLPTSELHPLPTNLVMIFSGFNRLRPFALGAFFLSLHLSLLAVPFQLNYQGRVVSNGVAFSGDGQFKFALVNGDASVTYWSNDGTSVAGSAPTAAVTVAVSSGRYALQLGDASIANMTALPAAVFDNDSLFLRVWFSNGTGPFELLSPDRKITSVAFALKADSARTVESLPDDFVSETKLDAALRTKLASLQTQITTLQTSLNNLPTPNNGVDGTDGADGVGIQDVQVADNGNGTFNLTFVKTDNSTHVVTTPNLRGAQGAAGADGAAGTNGAAGANGVGIQNVQVADNGNGSFNLTFVKTDNSTVVVSTPNLRGPQGPSGPQGPAGVAGTIAASPTGNVVASSSSSDATLTGAGYVTFQSFPADSWSDSPGDNPLTARYGHSAVWTGTSFAIWGGTMGPGFDLSNGSIYEPSAKTWTPISPLDAPSARYEHSAVWSGSDMLVWGGRNSIGSLGNGKRYNLATQAWSDIAATGAPSARYDNVALWVNSRMLVWGGRGNTSLLNDGALYNPSDNSWTTLNASLPVGLASLPARYGAQAAVAGDSVLIWGGIGASGPLNTGLKLSYVNGAPTAWSQLSTTGAPIAREGHVAVWTGSRLLVWGGLAGGAYLNSGASYDPVTDTWAAISTTNAPTARSGHAAVWTGSELVLAGGENAAGTLADSFAYNPVSNSWRALPGVVGSRSGAAITWTGSQVLLFGGAGDWTALSLAKEIDPAPPIYLYRKQ